MHVGLRVIVLVSLLVLWHRIGAAPLMSPAENSDDVRTHLMAEPELRLRYRIERSGLSTEIVTIGVARDYHYKITSGGIEIYDYRARRIFRVLPHGEFVNDSLHAEVWFRRAELESRAIIIGSLNGAALGASQDVAAQDPFWVETELGLTTPRFARPPLERQVTADRVAWRLKNQEVAAIRYRKQTTPIELRASLLRLWLSIVSLHPAIVNELAQSERMPEELWITEFNHADTRFQISHWVLDKVEWLRHPEYPLPPHRAAEPSLSGGAFPEIFHTLTIAVSSKRRPPSMDTYHYRIESALAHGAGLEALVWLIEMQLAAGVTETCGDAANSNYCLLAARVRPIAEMDARTALAFAKQAPNASERAHFDTLPNAYLLRLLWANRTPRRGIDRVDPELDLLHAVQASPVASFCKDVGDFYVRSWRPFAAWQTWDLGRLMVGHIDGDSLREIDNMEAEQIRREAALY